MTAVEIIIDEFLYGKTPRPGHLGKDIYYAFGCPGTKEHFVSNC